MFLILLCYATFMKIIHPNLKLDQPLIIFDLETTGLAIGQDKIIELGYLKIYPDEKIEKDDLYFNPQMRIPQEVSAIHGITNADLINAPFFETKAQEIFNIFQNCAYGGFNILKFDLPFLKKELELSGLNFDYNQAKIFDSQLIFNQMEPRTLSAAYKFYCNKEHIDAHSAIGDVEATAEVLAGQFSRYEQLQDPIFIEQMYQTDKSKFVDNDRRFYWRDNEAYFSFSKHKNKSLRQVAQTEPDFLRWILGADFSPETKEIAQKALNGEFPKKETAN